MIENLKAGFDFDSPVVQLQVSLNRFSRPSKLLKNETTKEMKVKRKNDVALVYFHGSMYDAESLMRLFFLSFQFICVYMASVGIEIVPGSFRDSQSPKQGPKKPF